MPSSSASEDSSGTTARFRPPPPPPPQLLQEDGHHRFPQPFHQNMMLPPERPRPPKKSSAAILPPPVVQNPGVLGGSKSQHSFSSSLLAGMLPLPREYSLDDQGEREGCGSGVRAMAAISPQQEKQQQPEYIFVALYDFHGSSDGSQLSLRRGDQVRVLGYNKTREWCEAQLVARGPSLRSPSGTSVRSGGSTTMGAGPSETGIGSSPTTMSAATVFGNDGPVGWVPTLYVAPASALNLERHLWFHGGISRAEAERLLGSGITGSFLVRDSETSPGQYSISLRHEGRVFHYRINMDPVSQKMFISPDARFRSLGELIHHHGLSPAGLVSSLQYPIPRRSQQPQRRSGAGYSGASTATVGELFSLSPTQPDDWEVDRTEITMNNKIGSGQYGDVYEAWWSALGRRVAVKSLKEDAMALSDFLTEAAVMKEINHPGLVRLLGVCTREAPFFIIAEFMDRGNLLQYIRDTERRYLPQQPVLLQMATQIASGMAYLEWRNFIHRDLAARNCLVSAGNVVKVGDFGLARCLKNDDTYTPKPGAKFPIKWTAPEGLAYNTFSTKSDVWAFGILLWEIVTYGMAPYPGVELMDVFSLLERGFRMDRPPDCPDSLYRVMLQCWMWSPSDRPRFQDLHKSLERMLEKGDSHSNHHPPPPVQQSSSLDTSIEEAAREEEEREDGDGVGDDDDDDEDEEGGNEVEQHGQLEGWRHSSGRFPQGGPQSPSPAAAPSTTMVLARQAASIAQQRHHHHHQQLQPPTIIEPSSALVRRTADVAASSASAASSSRSPLAPAKFFGGGGSSPNDHRNRSGGGSPHFGARLRSLFGGGGGHRGKQQQQPPLQGERRDTSPQLIGRGFSPAGGGGGRRNVSSTSSLAATAEAPPPPPRPGGSVKITGGSAGLSPLLSSSSSLKGGGQRPAPPQRPPCPPSTSLTSFQKQQQQKQAFSTFRPSQSNINAVPGFDDQLLQVAATGCSAIGGGGQMVTSSPINNNYDSDIGAPPPPPPQSAKPRRGGGVLLASAGESGGDRGVVVEQRTALRRVLLPPPPPPGGGNSEGCHNYGEHHLPAVDEPLDRQQDRGEGGGEDLLLPLQHLKRRLKKTVSESRVPHSDNLLISAALCAAPSEGPKSSSVAHGQSAMPALMTTSTFFESPISSSSLLESGGTTQRPAPKPRRSIDSSASSSSGGCGGGELLVAATGHKTNQQQEKLQRSTLVVPGSAFQHATNNKDEVNNKQQRMATDSGSGDEAAGVRVVLRATAAKSTMGGGGPAQTTRVQKVAPLYHHRPFSMQMPGSAVGPVTSSQIVEAAEDDDDEQDQEQGQHEKEQVVEEVGKVREIEKKKEALADPPYEGSSSPLSEKGGHQSKDVVEEEEGEGSSRIVPVPAIAAVQKQQIQASGGGNKEKTKEEGQQQQPHHHTNKSPLLPSSPKKATAALLKTGMLNPSGGGGHPSIGKKSAAGGFLVAPPLSFLRAPTGSSASSAASNSGGRPSVFGTLARGAKTTTGAGSNSGGSASARAHQQHPPAGPPQPPPFATISGGGCMPRSTSLRNLATRFEQLANANATAAGVAGGPRHRVPMPVPTVPKVPTSGPSFFHSSRKPSSEAASSSSGGGNGKHSPAVAKHSSSASGFSSGSSEKQQQQKPPAAAPLPSTTSKGQQTSKEKGPQTTTTSTLMIQQHVYSGVSGAHADSPGLEALGVVPPASTGTPVINKDYLSELQRRIKACLLEFTRNANLIPSASSGATGTTGSVSSLAKSFDSQPPSTTADADSKSTTATDKDAADAERQQRRNTLLIRFGDLLHQFQGTCTIYAENITPHSKFRFRELLARLDVLQRQLRTLSCSSSSSHSHSAATGGSSAAAAGPVSMVASFSAAATGGLQQQQRAGGQQHQQQQKVGMGLITASPSMEHLAGRSLQGTGEAAAQLVVADVELVIGSIMQLVNR